MLGIVTTKDATTNEIISVVAKNDCGFEFERPNWRTEEHYKAIENTTEREHEMRMDSGFASLGTAGKYAQWDCVSHNYEIEIVVYKNCNDDTILFHVKMDKSGIYLL